MTDSTTATTVPQLIESPATAPATDAVASSPFLLFSSPPAKGKWIDAISRLLKNDTAKDIFEVQMSRLLDLLADASAALQADLVVHHLNIDDNETCVLVGDIHGQFRDLQASVLSVQRKHREEGKSDVKYLFLGDYVDRGPCGLEVIILLLALKVEYPQLVYILRGNHELAQTCRMYGFWQECRVKLDVNIWQQFVTVFNEMPLAATVTCRAGSIFCAHGGLSPSTTAISALGFLNRSEYGEGLLGSNEESEVIDGLLWSDPSDRPGYRHNVRGCGYTFGPDTTKVFCTQNDVQFVCRAHQMVMEGYQWDHDGKLLTLFSAPNYCGINKNKGAVAILQGAAQVPDKPIQLQFKAYDSAPIAPCTLYDAKPSVDAVAEFFADDPGSPKG